jgi:hypothetical protein
MQPCKANVAQRLQGRVLKSQIILSIGSSILLFSKNILCVNLYNVFFNIIAWIRHQSFWFKKIKLQVL